jgi:DNA-binding beta-propeller fold protein YncE
MTIRSFWPLLIGLLVLDSIAETTLVLQSTIPLPQVRGRMDHFGYDAKTGRAFLAALENNTVEVIDARKGTLLASIVGMHKPTGIIFKLAENQIWVGNGDDGSIKILDGTTYRLIKSIGGLDDADNIRLDPKEEKVFLGFGDGALAMFRRFEKTETIKLPGHPEAFQLEASGDRIFINVPNAQELTVVDRTKFLVVAHWPLKQFSSNFPMALNETGGQIFVGCRNPSALVVLDSSTGNLLANVSTHGDADDLFWDPQRHQIYVSCGEGFIDVIEAKGNEFHRVEAIPTRKGARTSFFAPSDRFMLLAAPRSGSAPAELRVYSVK